MSLSLPRMATCFSVVAALLLIAGRCWAVFIPLGPSQDDWGLKYDIKVTAVGGGKVNVLFTLADEGRLKPIFTTTVVAFSDLGYDGSRTVLVQSPLELKPTKDGKLAGQTQISQEFVDLAQIRILTLSVDGKRQTAGAASYYIPLKRFPIKAPVTASPSVP